MELASSGRDGFTTAVEKGNYIMPKSMIICLLTLTPTLALAGQSERDAPEMVEEGSRPGPEAAARTETPPGVSELRP